jgi:hypothetical protein
MEEEIKQDQIIENNIVKKLGFRKFRWNQDMASAQYSKKQIEDIHAMLEKRITKFRKKNSELVFDWAFRKKMIGAIGNVSILNSSSVKLALEAIRPQEVA